MAESTILTGQFVRISQTPASIGERIIAYIFNCNGIIQAPPAFGFHYDFLPGGNLFTGAVLFFSM